VDLIVLGDTRRLGAGTGSGWPQGPAEGRCVVPCQVSVLIPLHVPDCLTRMGAWMSTARDATVVTL
jgi:hypothetical protein